jgi:hypothetical protein
MRIQLCVLALAAVMPAQVGKPMPSLEIDRLFNLEGAKPKNFEQLRGSTILLEYWQTW